MTPNLQFQRSVNSRLRRLLPPAELGRYAATELPNGDARMRTAITGRHTRPFLRELLLVGAIIAMVPMASYGQDATPGPCSSGSAPPHSARMDLAKLSLVVPDSVIVRSGRYDNLTVFSDRSEWLSLLSVVASPLARVNGYPDQWNDLDGYARFSRITLQLASINGTTWARYDAPYGFTLFHIAGGVLYQVSHDRLPIGAAYEPIVQSIIASLCLSGE